jgi:4-amino-4-deoxy-L-arabinose transferase-like glycosyltransferase
MYKNYFLFLCVFLAAKAAAMLSVILYAGIGLGPDEAQYWTWSQHLDWGYYSKPPGIAWEIWLGTSLFGSNELGVRAMPLVIGFLLPIGVYLLAKACALKPSTCFWAALAFAFSPAGIMASLLAITDGGMVLFWTLSVAYLTAALNREEKPNYLVFGLLIGMGALFKWPVYVLWIFVLILWFFYPWLASWKALGGVTISLLALLPTAYWNATHDWATFKHVFSTLAGGHGKTSATALVKGNFFEFLGSQAALFSPILFVLLVLALWNLFKQRYEVSRGLLLCGVLTLGILGVAMGLSVFMKMQGNWGIFAYPTAAVVLCWYACEQVISGRKWLVVGCALSVVLTALAFSIPSLQTHDVRVPYRFNPFRHNVGWDRLEGVLLGAGYNPEKDFLLSDKYQTTSILSFYGPRQKRAYFFNLQRNRKNQFSYWPSIADEQVGKRGFFVVVENLPHLTGALSRFPNLYVDQLKPYFTHIRYLGMSPLFTVEGETAKGALIFEGIDYLGGLPKDPELY